jgi:SAM-dependent methyltransferase/uncharacterized protein YbaR (Trm112 family)
MRKKRIFSSQADYARSRTARARGRLVDDERRLSPSIYQLLRCPVCRAKLVREGNELVCLAGSCGTRFPIVNGIPILLNEATTVFTMSSFVRPVSTRLSPLWRALHVGARWLPDNGRNPVAARNYARFANHLLMERPKASVLVIGGRIVGQGMEAILSNERIAFVETDVDFGPRTQLVCDALELPFPDRSFDGVIIQAVLEHVTDPYRAVAEIHRVLNDDGLVYAETPFMQQVHGGSHDFTRFTHLGHHRLFRNFEEIDSGAAGGPGTALAWSYEYFLLSFVRGRFIRGIVRAFSRLTAFWLKYVDSLVANKPGAIDASSGHYFLGRKSAHTLSDRDLLKLYRGPQREIRI